LKGKIEQMEGVNISYNKAKEKLKIKQYEQKCYIKEEIEIKKQIDDTKAETAKLQNHPNDIKKHEYFIKKNEGEIRQETGQFEEDKWN